MRRSLINMTSVLLTLVLVVAIAAEEPKGHRRIELQDGDTLVFCGDSITHQCLYSQYVETFFYTRYPERRIRFHNASVGGDRVGDALARFHIDIAPYKPKYVTILLGMNDGTYQHFNHDVFKTYETGMEKLLDQISGLSATAIPMTPTMFDLRAAAMNPRRKARMPQYKYYNGVLAFYGAWLRDRAAERGLGFVDMYGPLNAITIQQRKKDANFTLIRDAVHPDAPGQVVMAFAILNDMHVNRRVSSIMASQGKNGWKVRGDNSEVSNVVSKEGQLAFDFQAKSLPWVLPPDAALGYELTIAGHKMSSERLRVATLPTGDYDVKIDGQLVGTWSNLTLAKQVELQGNEKTPQYQQALKVALLNQERNEKAIRPLRNTFRGLRDHYRKGTDKSAPDEFAAFLEKFKVQVAELEKLAHEYEDQIYAAAQPRQHHYEIRLAE